ncbi:orotate phosphoribosyltransferase [Propionibacterium cyclohexanicum]|uniref:Orotate phosphoribosyltransferase n=1 Tax=Propionibacterium cyclohexanicum TaxID=64702 RepID=A0A1H9SUH7_9ACTN|nr:orotate phosphoribosyltransferase [Propionibacterium cyclohexanicum]SER88505.1 orotate phosphoribosyltransferase [Propionibacterium cyclohexanicum]
MTDRETLRNLIAQQAVVRGQVVLSSGKQADYYIDMRRITLSGTAAPLVGRVMLDLVSGWQFDVVGGLTMGADPVAAAMLHAASAAGQPVDACVVRKDAKTHGLHRRIEGPGVQGRRVLVVEDTSTTGNSALTAVEALRQEGAQVIGVADIVDRSGGAVEQAIRAAGLAYLYAYDAADLGL